jgi:tRNA pseudouridine55 synthase
MSPLGLINLNKASGYTSHDCVAIVRRILRTKRVGHGGTLDPAATGVLPIAVGKATRLLQFMPPQKEYRAWIRLGVQTTTDDLEGEVIRTCDASTLTVDNVAPLLKQFIGKVTQIPPAYSAIQKDGKRLYELARAGEVVDVPERTVEIYEIEVLDWYEGESPEIVVRIACGSGTYIRAIARDLGTMLNTGGTLAKLQRTLSCNLRLEDSLTLEELEEQVKASTFTPISPHTALAHLSPLNLDPDTAKRWCQGQKIPFPAPQAFQESSFMRVYETEDKFLGIGVFKATENGLILIPKTVLYQP